MPKVKTPKPYCAGTLTEAAFRSKIINALRKVSMFWKPKNVAMKRAMGGTRTNPKTGKDKTYYVCEESGEFGWLEDMHADHVEPVVPDFWGDTTRFLGVNWNEYVKRMFVEEDGYQIILKSLHKIKTKEENQRRRESKKQ